MKDEIRGRPLIFPVEPIVGEGLAELVLRASAENCFLNTLNIMDLAGIPGIHAGSIGSSVARREAVLAHLLGPSWSVDGIAAIAFQADKRTGWHSWFGTSIRRIHRMAKVRRVSPRSLAASLHCKAMWSLKPLCFDPDTREQLLEQCPVCGNLFRFRNSFGVEFCDQCSRIDAEGFVRGAVDLRDFPQPIVEVDDDEALSLVVNLINPDAAVRHCARGLLPADIAAFEEGQLFELSVILASILTSDPTLGKGRANGLKSMVDYRRITPASLARAGRALLGWPGAFDNLLEEMQSSWAQRPGNYGVRKTLGPLAELQRSRNLESRLKGILQARISANLARAEVQSLTLRKCQPNGGDLITLIGAIRKFRIGRQRLEEAQLDGISTIRAKSGHKSPILVSVSELSENLARRSDLLAPLHAARRIGIPILALRHLADAGLISGGQVPCVSGIVVRDSTRYGKQSVDELLKRLHSRLEGTPPPARALSLSAAAVRLGSPLVSPWVGLLRSILDGNLPVWRSKTKQPPAFSLFVDPAVAQESVKDFNCWSEGDTKSKLSAQCVASMLGMQLTTLKCLRHQGLLQAPYSLSEIQTFARNYASTREVRDILREHSRFGNAALVQDQIESRTIPSLLQILGLRPASGLEVDKNFMWKRSEIECLVAEWPKIGGVLASRQ
jgi:hypothetical protein